MNTTSGLVRDLLGNYHLGATLTDDDILHAAESILEQKLMRSGEALTDPSASARYLKMKLAGYPYEVFGCLFLDNRHRVLAFEELFRGSIDGCSVHPREVIRRCLHHNAAAVILAHYVARNIMGVMCPVFLCGPESETWRTAMVSKRWMGT